MIRIQRGPEPAALLPVREAELRRVRPLVLAGGLNSDAIGQEYAVVKRELWMQQLQLCCYCESPIQCAYCDVEHFRPKARAVRQNGTMDPGYWWLAWTWENLLFSCPNCNRSAKKDLFPLETGSVPLLPEEAPPGREQPTLIDPCGEDPVDSIQFVFDGKHWRPTGRNGNTRGQRTVELLGLDRMELLEHYNAHVEGYVKPHIEATREAIEARDEGRIHLAWRRVRGLLFPRRPFVALSFDAIERFVPAAVRAPWGLELPRPTARGP